MRRVLPIAALVIALVAVLAAEVVAAGQRQPEVAITLTDFKVSMASTSIPAGTPVKFTATNKGQAMHELVLEPAGSDDQPFEMNGRETEIEDIGPGETKSATWTITQPGEYQLACHVSGHFEAGMVERFAVTAASDGAEAQTQVGAATQAALHETQPAAEEAAAFAAAEAAAPVAPMTLAVTQTSSTLSALFWVAAGTVVLIAAVIGAFRLVVKQISGRE